VTASANPVATAASMALPPFLRMDSPTFDAIGDTLTTMPLLAFALWANAEFMQRNELKRIVKAKIDEYMLFLY
jgi:hypothetical protein